LILYYTHRKFGESNIIDNCFVRLAKQAERVDITQDKFWNNIPNTKIWKNADILWAEINKGDRLK